MCSYEERIATYLGNWIGYETKRQQIGTVVATVKLQTRNNQLKIDFK